MGKESRKERSSRYTFINDSLDFWLTDRELS